MTDPAPRLSDYLSHIAQAIERIQRYTNGMDEAAFKANDLVQDAVIRNLEIIGEACRNIDRAHPDFAVANPQLPLGVAYEMRNVLAHGYFKVDVGMVWQTLQGNLPPLLQQVRQLLQQPADHTAG